MKVVAKELQNIVSNQISLNKGANLFSVNKPLMFSPELYDNIARNEIYDGLADYAVNCVLEEFYRVNQYYCFNAEAIKNLKSIYLDLHQTAKQKTHTREELSLTHSRNLRKWLQQTNSFAETIYSPELEKVDETPCFEYSPELQLDVLHLDLTQLKQPVLDIGCGQNGNLVEYLRGHGMEAFGIDRYPSNSEYIENISWLDYDYGVEKWGTIISNLGFSNHFQHHHLRTDGDYENYARTFMRILKSLKVGGRFHYAPSLPFIEKYLNLHEFKIERIKLKTTGSEATIVSKLK